MRKLQKSGLDCTLQCLNYCQKSEIDKSRQSFIIWELKILFHEVGFINFNFVSLKVDFQKCYK